MSQKNRNAQASILDRLIDNDPGSSREPVQYRLSVGQIKDAVVRDLENLLNTRRQILLPPAEYREVNSSSLLYGLQDFTSKNPESPFVRQRLRQAVEQTISRYEPRLKNVTVQVETPNKSARDLRFRITAVLSVEPIAEPVTFDTYFDVSRSEYRISR
jgi:type VI secretion system protein ImpF